MERDMEKGMSMIVLRKDGRIIMFINGKSSSVGTSRAAKTKGGGGGGPNISRGPSKMFPLNYDVL